MLGFGICCSLSEDEGYFTRYAELTGICELKERVEESDAYKSHNHQGQI